MHRLAVDDCSANHGAAIDGAGCSGRPVGCGAVNCDVPIGIIFDATNGDIGRPTNARGVFCNDIQYRLNIRRRAGDDTQNFARRSLLLQGLGEIAVALLQFFEQPHVLDGDHRLVGEGFKQLDLRRGEGAHFGATRVQHSNEFSLLTKGNDQEGAQSRRRNPTLENRSARGRRECGACHARASSETVAHQY